MVYCALVINFVLWIVVHYAYLTYFAGYDAWTEKYIPSFSSRDMLVMTIACITIVLLTFCYVKLAMLVMQRYSKTLVGKMLGHGVLFVVNLLTSICLSAFLYSVVMLDREDPICIPIMIYMIIATFCSEIYLSICYNKTIELSRAAEMDMKVKQTESDRLAMAEKLKRLELQTDSHFMFNSLGTLSILINRHPESALDFCNSLTDCFRYLTTSSACSLIALNEEMDFVKNYATLMDERFGKAAIVSVGIIDKGGYVPPLSIQSLVENAMKHNSSSEAHPLRISVERERDSIVVRNNISPMLCHVPSTGIGLNLLKEMYASFGKEIAVESDGKEFVVRVPIIYNNPAI